MYKDFKVIKYSVSKFGISADSYNYGVVDCSYYFYNVKDMKKYFKYSFGKCFKMYYIRMYKEAGVLSGRLC